MGGKTETGKNIEYGPFKTSRVFNVGLHEYADGGNLRPTKLIRL